ncbi:MAG TPA: peptide deformylase [Candidatus Paceibacterota bacterium]
MILQVGDPRLRTPCREVSSDEASGSKTRKLIRHMQAVLEGCPDGVALAAPQIGENVRIFVVSPRAFAQASESNRLVYINPRVRKSSAKYLELEEGCLSVRNVYGKILRKEKITIEAVDERGKRFVRGGSGLLSEIFQHEIEHLDGILFTDTAKELREIKDTTGDAS